MEIVKQIDFKNRTYYFYNDMVDMKTFDSNLLKINIGIATYFVYYKYIDHNEENVSEYDCLSKKNY